MRRHSFVVTQKFLGPLYLETLVFTQSEASHLHFNTKFQVPLPTLTVSHLLPSKYTGTSQVKNFLKKPKISVQP